MQPSQSGHTPYPLRHDPKPRARWPEGCPHLPQVSGLHPIEQAAIDQAEFFREICDGDARCDAP